MKTKYWLLACRKKTRQLLIFWALKYQMIFVIFEVLKHQGFSSEGIVKNIRTICAAYGQSKLECSSYVWTTEHLHLTRRSPTAHSENAGWSWAMADCLWASTWCRLYCACAQLYARQIFQSERKYLLTNQVL